MKQLLFFSVLTSAILSGCSSNPNHAERLETRMTNASVVTGDLRVGVKSGNMIVQRKVLMAEELRSLQNSVYELEDRVYGNRTYGSLGLYGVLRDCRTSVVDKNNGGSGHLIWTEPLDRVTDKEEDYTMGLDEHGRIIGVSEEYLRDRITRFKNYKLILQKREDEYVDKVAICQASLKSQRFDVQATNK